MAQAIIQESTADEQFYFSLEASNGEVVAASEGYTELRNAVGGFEALVVAVLELVIEGIRNGNGVIPFKFVRSSGG